MSSNRRFEYDKGPRPEAEQPGDENERDVDGTEGEGNDGGGSIDSNHPVAAVEPWLAGLVSGVSAFTVVFVATYQLAGAMFAGGAFGGEVQPSRWVVSGLMMLSSHGAPIELGDDPIRGGFMFVDGLTSHVTALVPAVVLLVVGYFVVRYVRLETSHDAGLALGSLIVSYLVLAIALSAIATWTPEGNNSADVETIAVSTDVSMLLTTGGTVVAFVALGAAVAALPRLLEAAPIELVDESD